jgi:hypothetical protein
MHPLLSAVESGFARTLPKKSLQFEQQSKNDITNKPEGKVIYVSNC